MGPSIDSVSSAPSSGCRRRPKNAKTTPAISAAGLEADRCGSRRPRRAPPPMELHSSVRAQLPPLLSRQAELQLARAIDLRLFRQTDSVDLSPEAVLEAMQNALPNGRIGLALIVMDEKQGGLWFPELERCRVDQAAKRSDKAPLLRRPSQRLGNLASPSDLRRRHGPGCCRVGAVGAADRTQRRKAGEKGLLRRRSVRSGLSPAVPLGPSSLRLPEAIAARRIAAHAEPRAGRRRGRGRRRT